MVTVAEVVNYLQGLANRGARIDQDGAYGSQCVDLPNHISQKFFGRPMRGNGIDMLNAAAGNGYAVYRSGTPQPGAITCFRESSHPYGHTGMVISASGTSYRCVEQNYGASASLSYGGPAVYVNRVVNYGHLVGWAMPPYSGQGSINTGGGDGAPATTTKPQEVEIDSMMFGFNIRGGGYGTSGNAVYVYNGYTNTIYGCRSNAELDAARNLYKATHGGRDMPLRTYAKTPGHGIGNMTELGNFFKLMNVKPDGHRDVANNISSAEQKKQYDEINKLIQDIKNSING